MILQKILDKNRNRIRIYRQWILLADAFPDTYRIKWFGTQPTLQKFGEFIRFHDSPDERNFGVAWTPRSGYTGKVWSVVEKLPAWEVA